MAKNVVGVYNNQTELIDAIEEYKNKGYSVQDFSIIGDTNDITTALGSRTGVTTENISTDHDNHREGGFWQSLMTAFDADRNLGGNEPSISDRLVGLGLTDDAAREYEEDVRAGRIILLAETNTSGLDVEETGYVTDTSTVTGAYNADRYSSDEQTLKLGDLERNEYTNQTGLERNEYRDQANLERNEYTNQTGLERNEYRDQANLERNGYTNQTDLERNEYRNQTNLESNEYKNETDLERNEYRNQTNLERNEYTKQTGLERNEYTNQTGLERNEYRKPTGLDRDEYRDK